jgi:hypothetical protein
MADPSYNLATYTSGNVTYADIFGIGSITGYTYFINKEETLLIRGVNSGVVTADGTNDILITIPPATSSSNYQYTRKQIFDIINGQFNSSANQVFAGSSIYTKTINGIEYVNIRLNINKLYTAKDYRLVFYDPYSFVKCFVGAPSVRNVTWDSTLGWILGFRNGVYENNSNYVSESIVDLNTIKYLYLVVDDYNNSVNNGFYSAFNSSILNKNILARISLQSRNPFQQLSENNLNLITQPREYFGPVTIQNLTIQLLDPYGRILDLNNNDYSFALTMQSIYDI